MSKKPKLCTVVQDGPVWRVVDHDGKIPGGPTADSDGGGFADKRDAEHVAATINARRLGKA